MSAFEVEIEGKVRVVAANFQAAADLAVGIVDGSEGCPDSASVEWIGATAVRNVE